MHTTWRASLHWLSFNLGLKKNFTLHSPTCFWCRHLTHHHPHLQWFQLKNSSYNRIGSIIHSYFASPSLSAGFNAFRDCHAVFVFLFSYFSFDRSETKTKHDYYREKYNLGNSTVQIQEASSQKELTGILLKRGKLNKAFKMRRFQLKNAQLTYHEPQTLVVKGKISVPDVTDITITEPSEMCPEMQIQTTVRLYTLRSPTNSYNELRQWKDAINSSRYLDQGKSTNHNWPRFTLFP